MNWTKTDIILLQEHYGKIPNKDLAAMLGTSKQAIQHKAHRLGITTRLVAEKRYCIDCGKELCRAASWNKIGKRCRACADANHAGENHHNWNGGVAALRSLVHVILKPVWIDPIMRRDNFTCQECGTRGGEMNVHHLQSYSSIRDSVLSQHPHLNLHKFADKKRAALLIVEEHDLEDGVTLCVDCHVNAHKLNSGELLGHPTVAGSDEGNQQPSLANIVQFVARKVQRLEGEEAKANNPSTSARHLPSRRVKI